MLLTGGEDSSGAALSTAEIYQPGTETFIPTANSMSSPRVAHTATLLATGKVLVAGGGPSTQADLFDPATGSFAPTKGMMTSTRIAYTATLLADGRVLLAGGIDAHLKPLASAELYDPATDSFAATGSMSTPRVSHTATLLPDGKVLIAAGDSTGRFSGDLSSAELYDPASGKFTLLTATLATARADHTATLTAGGTAVLIAGGSDVKSTALKSAELFDIASATFRSAGDMSVRALATRRHRAPRRKDFDRRRQTRQCYDRERGSLRSGQREIHCRR